MKRKICFIIALTMIFCWAMQISTLADNITPYNNHTARTSTAFAILDGGLAAVSVEFLGYENITTGATITIKIEKRNLLIFWTDIVDETITVSGNYYSNEFTYQLEKTGTYRCTVEYVVSGTAGDDDVIPFEATRTYE